MSRDNVKRVLVTEGNQAPLAAGSKPDALALGQIGVFDTKTGLSIDQTSTPKNFFIAVGIDATGEGVMNDIKESAGQMIQSDNLRGYTFRPHTAARPQIIRLQGVTPDDAVEEYAFKFEFRNMEAYKLQGTNQLTQTYAIKNEKYSQEVFIDKVVEAVNANDQGFVDAEKVVVTTRAFTVAGDSTSKEYASGDVVDVAGDETIVRGDGSFIIEAKFTALPVAVNRAVNLNLKYREFRQTVIIGSLVEGFDTSVAALTTVQEIAYEEGDGAQVRQREFNETGVARPYVLSDSTGTARDMMYIAKGGVKYDQFVLEYDQFSVAGWLEHLNNLETRIAVPADDTATRDALVDILDAQFENKGFDGNSEVAKSSVADATVVEESSDDETQV